MMNLDELLKAAITDPSKRSPFLQTLIKSDVYVICKKPVKYERGREEGGIQLELITIRNPHGDVFIPLLQAIVLYSSLPNGMWNTTKSTA